MMLLKMLFCLLIFLICELIFAVGAWAWGPAVHTVIGCRILDEASQILLPIARIIQTYPLQYLYGSLAADFFVGKGQKKRDGHSHNWETGFKFFEEARDDREAAYAYGFFSHLAADVVAHNYFVPELIQRVYTWKRMGHIYCEVKADQFVGPFYMKIARELLSAEDLGCDDLLQSAVKTSRNGLKTRKHLFSQTVKLSDFLSGFQPMSLTNKDSRYQVSQEYLTFMVHLAYRLVKDFLIHTTSSRCLSYDPIGSTNLRLASRNRIFSRIFNNSKPLYRFTVDQELLKL